MHFVTIELVRKINDKVGGNHHFIFTSVLNNCEIFDSDQLKKYCKRLTKFTQSYLKQSLKKTHGKLWHFMAVLSCFPMHGLSDLTLIATLTVQPSLGTRKWLYYLYLLFPPLEIWLVNQCSGDNKHVIMTQAWMND